MNYGMYVSASGVLTSLYRQDIHANNLANINTAGFKPEITTTVAREAARVEDGLAHLPSNLMLERLGAGVLLAPNRVSTEQGALERTGEPLDLAIEGEGFFVIGTPDGPRLSRDGRLTVNADGLLVQAASGMPVLDASDETIRLDPRRPVTVASDGTLSQGGPGGGVRLGFVAVDAAGLRKIGDNLLEAPPAAMNARRAPTGRVHQGAIERSAVDPIKAMLGVTSAATAVTNNARMIQLFDDLMNRTISTFARMA
jgi:flagellar basal-body rod protein FlgF